jgi:hypothetical protein
MIKLAYHCESCDKHWFALVSKPEQRRCKFCHALTHGEEVKPVPPVPPAPKNAAPTAKLPRRWETAAKAKPEEPATEAPKAAAEAEIAKPKAEIAKPKAEIAKPKAEDSPSKRDYVPVDRRPENQRPRPRFFRFFALNSSSAPGIAGAVAESRDEAVERIVLRFLQNVALLSNRNQRIASIRLQMRPLMKEQSQQEFVRVLSEQGITPQHYDRMIGSSPPDTLGGWNSELQHSVTEEAANLLKQELMHAAYIEYPLEDCAFYMGGAVAMRQ